MSELCDDKMSSAPSPAVEPRSSPTTDSADAIVSNCASPLGDDGIPAISSLVTRPVGPRPTAVPRTPGADAIPRCHDERQRVRGAGIAGDARSPPLGLSPKQGARFATLGVDGAGRITATVQDDFEDVGAVDNFGLDTGRGK